MSLFGEIVEPGTRTAWEDWDEAIQNDDNQPRLAWDKDVVVPAKIQTFLILEGKHIADSVQALTKLKLEYVNAIQPININLYRLDSSDVYVCVLRDYNLLLASEIVELLKSYIISSNDVIAIMTKPIVVYQASEYVEHSYVIRTLTTTKPLNVAFGKNIPKLEQPNIISGVSAGAIMLRELNNKPGMGIVCYMEHSAEYQIDELQGLLKHLNIGPVHPKADRILMNSNLYI